MSGAGFPCSVTAYDMKDEEKEGYALYLIRLESSEVVSCCSVVVEHTLSDGGRNHSPVLSMKRSMEMNRRLMDRTGGQS